MKVRDMKKLLDGANPEAEILLKFIGNTLVKIELDEIFFEPPLTEKAFVFDCGAKLVKECSK